MKPSKLVLLGAVALVLGIVLPLALNMLLPQPRPAPTPIPVYKPAEPQGDGVSGRRLELGVVYGLTVFRNYTSLHEYLKMIAGLRAIQSRFQGVVGPAVPRVIPEREGDVIRDIAPVSTPATPTVEPAPVSKTNVQVEGVDEPDIVKTNGVLITVASDSKVYVVNAREKAVVSVISVEGSVRGLYLQGRVLTVIADAVTTKFIIPDVDCRCFYITPQTPLTILYVFNLENPSSPELLTKITVTGSMVGSRLKDTTVYLVTSLPIGGGEVLPLVNDRPVPVESIYGVDDKPDAYTVILALDYEKLEYSVYAFLTGSGSWIYMSHRNLYIAQDTRYTIEDAYYDALMVTAKYVPEEIGRRIEDLVESGRAVEAIELVENYLLNLSAEEVSRIIKQVTDELNAEHRGLETDFHVFNTRGIEVVYRGSFKVPGILLDQFAMEEYLENYFIVATTERRYTIKLTTLWFGPTREETPVITEPPVATKRVRIATCTGDACTVRYVYVAVPHTGYYDVKPWTPPPLVLIVELEERDTVNSVFTVDLGKMTIAGSVTGIAPGERVFAARLVKYIFFLVTAREVDPLFAIDVSNPENPVVLGYLKLPGFTEYLHPLPGDRLLGVGSDEGFDLKISLFDVSNPANMKEVAKIVIKPGWSIAFRTHHAVTVYLERSLAFIPYNYVEHLESSGILVVKFTPNNLTLQAILEHPGAVRTIYIGEEAYTVSPHSIKVYNLNNYEEVAYIPLKP